MTVSSKHAVSHWSSNQLRIERFAAGSMQLLHTLQHADIVFNVAASSDGSQRVLSGAAVIMMVKKTSVCASGMLLLEFSWQYCTNTWMKFVVSQWAYMAVWQLPRVMMQSFACGIWPPSVSAPGSKDIRAVCTLCFLYELPILWDCLLFIDLLI